MPVLVNEPSCLDRPHCYAAGACPNDAFYHNALRHSWEVDATRCGECPGPCLNFCDADALRWADNLFELDLVRRQLAGELTPEQLVEARAAHKAEEAAAAAEKQKAAGGAVVVVTAKNFQAEVLQAALPVVMDCWAAWCAPCRKFAPIFEAAAKQYAGILKFVKLDTEKEQRLAQQLGIRALPTTLFFYKGQLAHGVEGAIPTVKDFSALLDQVLQALRQMDPTLAAPVPALEPADAPAPAPTPAGAAPGGLILGPDPGPAPAPPAAESAASARRPTRPRLYRP